MNIQSNNINPGLVYNYPLNEREEWENKPIGSKLGVDYSQSLTPVQKAKAKVITAIAVALIGLVGAALMSSYSMAAVFSLAALLGSWLFAKIGPDFDNAEVRAKIIQDFFKNPPTLQQITAKYSTEQIFDYQLLPQQMDYVKYAVLASCYNKNKTMFENDVNTIKATAKGEKERTNSELNSEKKDLSSAQKDYKNELYNLSCKLNRPGCKDLYFDMMERTPLLLQRRLQNLEQKQTRTDAAIRECERKEADALATAQNVYSITLTRLEDQFKNLIPRPAALPIAHKLHPMNHPAIELSAIMV